MTIVIVVGNVLAIVLMVHNVSNDNLASSISSTVAISSLIMALLAIGLLPMPFSLVWNRYWRPLQSSSVRLSTGTTGVTNWDIFL